MKHPLHLALRGLAVALGIGIGGFLACVAIYTATHLSGRAS